MSLPSRGKEVVVDPDSRGWELTESPVVQRLNLSVRATHGRARSDVLGPRGESAHASRGQHLDGGLVDADHAAQGAFDEVELVLKDEFRRAEWLDPDRRDPGRMVASVRRH